jgi:pyrroloquinoline-quinone synthase
MTAFSDKKINDTPGAFLRLLDETIARHSLLDHPFYQAWNDGKLTKERLAEYAKQYYAHVKNFPVYLSATHSRCDDIQVRQLLLENLVDEEQGEENHPELWLRFAEGLGLQRRDVREAELYDKTIASINAIKSETTSDNYLRGVAVLYAYESQVPEIAKSKREGLKAFYGVDDERAVSYFTVHEEADLIHRRMERDILKEKAVDEASRREVLEAAEAGARAMWTFLDGCYEACVKTA